jgi:hypothetical protein
MSSAGMQFIESLCVDLRRGLNTGTHPFGSHALWDQAKSLGDCASGSRDSRDGISYLTGAALLAVIAPAEISTFILGASRYGIRTVSVPVRDVSCHPSSSHYWGYTSHFQET